MNEKSQPEIQIKNATPEDARGINEVLYSAWLATYPNEEANITVEDIEYMYRDRFTDESLQKSAARFENVPDTERRIVARSGEIVIGFMRVQRDEASNTLKAIYVRPEYQGRGIGTMLWEEAIRFFDSDKDIYVQVATYNQKAINFYSKLGFEDTGKRMSLEQYRMRNGAIIPEMEMVRRSEKSG